MNESFRIHRGYYISGVLEYTQTSIFDNQSYQWNVCLSPGTYTLQLLDSSGSWSTNSVLKIYVGVNFINSYHLFDYYSYTYQFVLTSVSSFSYSY